MEYEQSRNKFNYYVESHEITDFWPIFDLQNRQFHVVQPNIIRILSPHFHAKKSEVLSGDVMIPNLTFLLIFPQKAVSNLVVFFSITIKMRALIQVYFKTWAS